MKTYFTSLLVILQILVSCQPVKEASGESVPIQDQTSMLPDYGTMNPSAPVETEQFAQLVGDWDCVSRDLDTSDMDNPKWYTNKATWRWEYVLGGHALLNKWWQEDTSPTAKVKEYFATGIFIFNPASKLWEAVVLNSRPHKISPKFQASLNNENLEMHDGSGKWLVTFYDIKKDSFNWKYEILKEDGTWTPISEIKAIRKNVLN